MRAAPGVLAVLTAADIPGVNDCSPAFGDDPILAADEVLFHGQVVFAVVAETRDAARSAVRLARIDVDSVAPRITVDDGLADGAEVLAPYEFRRGKPTPAIAAAAHRSEGRLRIGGQEHFYLEGQAALAVPGEDDEMRVHSSTQHPSEVQNLVAHMLGVPGAAVVCECRRMGGAFGGKESQAAQWACLAALAAHVTGRPAKVRLDRDDDMIMTGKRHDFRVDWRCGFDREGVLEGVDVELAGRCGYSADLSLGVNDRAMFHADNAYCYPAARIHSRRVRTDTVSNTAFRGFGGPQGTLFAERMMDAVAITLGLDPLGVRKRNLYASGRDVTPYGMRVDDHVVTRIVRRLERTSGYAARRRAIARFNARAERAGAERAGRARRGGTLRKGIALTPVKFGIAFTLKQLNQAGALVNVFTDGSVQVNHGGTEMGQGLYVKVAQVVAEELGVGIDRVRVTRDPHRQGAQYDTHCRLVRLRPERHGRAPRRAHHPPPSRRARRPAVPGARGGGRVPGAAWCRSARRRFPSSGSRSSRSPSGCRSRPPATTRPRRSPGTATPRAGARSSTSPVAPRAAR